MTMFQEAAWPLLRIQNPEQQEDFFNDPTAFLDEVARIQPVIEILAIRHPRPDQPHYHLVVKRFRDCSSNIVYGSDAQFLTASSIVYFLDQISESLP